QARGRCGRPPVYGRAPGFPVRYLRRNIAPAAPPSVNSSATSTHPDSAGIGAVNAKITDALAGATEGSALVEVTPPGGMMLVNAPLEGDVIDTVTVHDAFAGIVH